MLRLLSMLPLLLLTSPRYAQAEESSGDACLHLGMRLEKTIFRFDVLDLDLQFGEDAAREARRWLSTKDESDALADSLSTSLAHATEASGEIVFLRNVGLKRFLRSIDDSMQKAVRVGWLSADDFERISKELPDSYAFLAEGGIRDGDRLLYTVRGDSLRIRYLDGDGRVRLDEVDVGPERRIALLGSYFAPKSNFREGLLRSLREQLKAP